MRLNIFTYVYGCHVTVESDHKPLQAITKKPLSAPPPRLQRTLLRFMKYDIDIRYKPGKEMHISGTLSRASLPAKSPNSDDWEAQVLISKNLPVSDEKMVQLRAATKDDETILTVRNFIIEGWPEDTNNVAKDVVVSKGFQDEMSENDGLIFKCEQVVIPQTCRQEMLKKLHEGHIYLFISYNALIQGRHKEKKYSAKRKASR